MKLGKGLRVTPNVELVRLLGKGGMGSVWVADHLTLHTQVAVKFISGDERGITDKERARFQREAALAARIRSPHVVQIYDHGFIEETPFIVMELLHGESLAERIARGPLSVKQTGLMLSQVAEVLRRAHANGIVHRDIKAENLFLIESGYELFVKVLDFGVAKQLDEPLAGTVTTKGMLIGTPFYMCPEMLLEHRETPAADVWALTVCAYAALTGVLPFEADTVGALAVKLQAPTFARITEVRPELPAGLDLFFEHAFARDPAERIVEPFELADAYALGAELDLPDRPQVSNPGAVVSGSGTRVDAAADTVATPSHTSMVGVVSTTGDTELAPTPPSSRELVVPISPAWHRLAPLALIAGGALAGIWWFSGGSSGERSPSGGATVASSPAEADAPPSAAASSVDDVPTTVTSEASAASAAPAAPSPAAPRSTTTSSRPAPVPQPVVPQPLTPEPQTPEPRSCTRYDPVAGKKVFHKVCPG